LFDSYQGRSVAFLARASGISGNHSRRQQTRAYRGGYCCAEREGAGRVLARVAEARASRSQCASANRSLTPITEDLTMAQASASIDLAASADKVWQLIGGFNSLPDWSPNIPRSETTEGGRVRHVATSNGVTIVERLEKFDNAARSYSYSIVQAPFPITDYLATISVHPKAGGYGCVVDWSGTFIATGVSDSEASKLAQGLFEDGLNALVARFAPSTRVRLSTRLVH